MKCDICKKQVDYLCQEPVRPGTDVSTAKSICLECREKKVKELLKK